MTIPIDGPFVLLPAGVANHVVRRQHGGLSAVEEEDRRMVMTVLEAEVATERSGDLKRAFEESGVRGLPPPIRESFLLHEEHSNVWRIATVWSSREDLEVYRRSVDTPAGVVMFREAGAEPTLTINDMAGHLKQDRP